jgi:hypothetical protein
MSDYKEVLYVLGIVLVEVRSTQNAEKSRILTDIVHNVPARISRGVPQTEIINSVLSRAKDYGIEKTFSRYFKLASDVTLENKEASKNGSKT